MAEGWKGWAAYEGVPSWALHQQKTNRDGASPQLGSRASAVPQGAPGGAQGEYDMQQTTTLGRRASGGMLAVLTLAGLLGTPPAGATQSADPATASPASPEQAQAARLAAEIAALEAEIARLRERVQALAGSLPAPAPVPVAAASGAASPVAAPAATAPAVSPAPADGDLARRVDAIAAELERLDLGEAAAVADQSLYGLGPAASKVYRAGKGVSIGGYGEVIYQRPDDRRDDGTASGRTAEVDFLRAIAYIGYKFDDHWVLNTEIEWEHANTGRGGEVSVEFAYLDYLARPELNVRTGMVLLPMGFVNELHEPTTFVSTRRPGVESVIIPTTWRENGLGLFGDVGPFTYRTYVVNGLEGRNFTARGLRSGRQKGAFAKAEDLAWVGRLDYTGMPGLLAGVSAYVGDSGQGFTQNGITPSAGTSILEGHVEWRWRGLELRGLYAQAEVDDAAALNRALGLTGAASVGERLAGGYVQAAFDVFSVWGRGQQKLRPFVRYETYDTQDRVPAGYTANPANAIETLTLGVAWQPIDQVVFKLDFEDQDNDAGSGVDQLNLSLGYVF